MTGEEPVPPAAFHGSLPEHVRTLSEQQLRDLIDYCSALLQYHDRQLIEEIEAAPGEELLRVEERDSYTEVVKRIPCGEDCADCPHGPYLYHVRTVTGQDGETQLEWRFIGRMR